MPDHFNSKPLYTPDDLAAFPPGRDLAFPGEFPFTRGIQPTMYRGRLWTMRQYAGMGDAEESNRRYKFLLDQGTAGLSVAFDLPTQIGYDSDSPMALGEVGKVGVAIDSIEDMERLFDDIPLDRISTSMTINATASILLALYVAVARRTGAHVSKLSGTSKTTSSRSTLRAAPIFIPSATPCASSPTSSPGPARTFPSGTPSPSPATTCAKPDRPPRRKSPSPSPTASPTSRPPSTRASTSTRFAPRLSFFFNAHNNFLEEVAKFRAARRIWAGIMRDRFGAKNPRSWMLRFHTQTAGSTLTAQQPENNIVRTSLQAMAAVLGGTQSLHTNGYDEALALPTEAAARIALRTQQIIASESGVANTIDPVAGSFCIESLTNQIETEVQSYFSRIDKLGGMLPAIERGWVQQEIQNAAYEYQRAVDTGEATVVGVNRFTHEDEAPIPTQHVDEALERRQIERVRALRARRDPKPWQQSLDRIRDHARSGANLMPAILDAVESYATVGEIASTLREVFGEYRETVVI